MCRLQSMRHSQKHSSVSLTFVFFLDEVLCLVKDLTCAGSTSPNSTMDVLVLLLASRAARRLHQPCTISSRLRPARCCSRWQEHSSGCMQVLFLQILVMHVVRSAPPSSPTPSSCRAATTSAPQWKLGRLARIPSRRFPHLQP